MTVYATRGLVLRIGLLLAALATWLVTGGGRGRRSGPIFLCYHGVRPDQRDRFRRQMRVLAGRAVSVDVAARLKARRGLPTVAVTADDAFANLFDGPLADAAAAGVPVTVFAVSGCLGAVPSWEMSDGHLERGERTMTAPMIKDAIRSGHCRVGSHTETHPRLTTLPEEALRTELEGSRIDLGSLADTSVDDLAFPYGDFDARVCEAAWAAGYRRVHTLSPPAGGTTGGRVLGRWLVNPAMWMLEFRLTIDGAYRPLVALRRLLRRPGGGPQNVNFDDYKAWERSTASEGCAGAAP